MDWPAKGRGARRESLAAAGTMTPMTSRKRAVYVVHDRTTSAQPGILATAYESVEKAIADLNGFRAQQPDNLGPLVWSKGPGWANGRDAEGNPVFDVFGLTVAPDSEPAYFEKFTRSS